MAIEIVIADDHVMIREGLKQLLELDGDIKIIGEANDGEECLKLVNRLNPSVLLLDINMPKKNGLEVLKEMKEKDVKTKVLILTIHNEVEYLVKAIDIGVNGYILKDCDSNVLKKAIKEVYSGENYIQSSLTAVLKEKLRDKPKKNIASLTKRELQVLKLIAEGLYNKEIAYRLEISEKTVKNHVSNIFKKISVSDRTQAAVFAIKNNIVDIL